VRAVGLDLGERRIGVAVSDSRGVLASPYKVVVRSGDAQHDRLVIAGIMSEVGGEILVVGMPLSLSGAKGQAAIAAEAEVAALRAILPVPVVTYDERLTTAQAAKLRRDRSSDGVARTTAGADSREGSRAAGGRSRPVRANRQRGAGSRAGSAVVGRHGIDAEAAAVMLAGWLESRQP
jgi:putative Holliday junction resolvase